MHRLTLDRFSADLAVLGIDPAAPFTVAVSGGPDSLALLLLAHATLGDAVSAATVDHGLRPDAASEAAGVARICNDRGISHQTLRVAVESTGQGLQAAARGARYAALAAWCKMAGIGTLATAHHADDQAETLLMRLNRGAGLSGLSAIRATRTIGPDVVLVRPLLGWRKAALAEIVAEAGLVAAIDPANRDPRHDRTTVRALLDAAPFLDPSRLAAAARHLAESNAALDWAAASSHADRVRAQDDAIVFDPNGLPAEIIRRCILLILNDFGAEPDGPTLATLIARLQAGEAATVGGVMATPGDGWRFAVAPPRRAGP